MNVITVACLAIFALEGPTPTWDDIVKHLKSLPQLAEQDAKAQVLDAEQGRLKASYQPQVQANATAMSTDNPVGVFRGRLGNGEFRMQHFGIPRADGTFDTYPVNHPDPYTDVVLDLSVGYRFYDGGERAAMKRQLTGMSQALDLGKSQVWQELLGEYAHRSIQIQVLAQQEAKAAEVVADTEKVVAMLKALHEEGQVPLLSLTMGETSLAQAQAQHAGVKAQHRAAVGSLAVWIGMDGSVFPPPAQLALTKISAAGLQGKTYAEQSATVMAQALDHKSGQVRDRWLPAVDGFAKLENHQLSAQNWTVGVQASWKLWDGGGDEHLKAKYRAEAAEALAGQRKVERMMGQARTELHEYLIAVGARIKALEKAVTTARAAWQNHKALLEEGQLDQGTVFEVRTMLLDLESQLIAAKGQAQILAWRALGVTGADLEPYLRGER